MRAFFAAASIRRHVAAQHRLFRLPHARRHVRSSCYYLLGQQYTRPYPGIAGKTQWTLQRALHLRSSASFDTGEPTIYALSTAPGRAAIAVIRISGSACQQIYRALCPYTAFPMSRHATLRKLYTPGIAPSPATVLDAGALVLHFPAPNTVTGEDVLELHVHGGPAVVRAVLTAIPQCVDTSASSPSSPSSPFSQIRYAEPGEFTRRAFDNNRMTLPQIESLGETLSAVTEQQRKLSVRGTTSSLAKRYEYWRELLLVARGELEALIDFSEDQHFDESPAILCASVAHQIRGLYSQMKAHVANAMRGELLRNGISVALLGAPNAGKSSLLNCMVGRDAAIVSQEAGTTRDVVEVGIDLGGWLVRMGDMAGLRRAGLVGAEQVGAVEQEGIRRAKQRALESNVVIIVQDATLDMDPEVVETAKQCLDSGIHVLVAINKSDRVTEADGTHKLWLTTIRSTLGISSNLVTFISCKDATIPSSGNLPSFLETLQATFRTMTSALVPDSHSDSDPDPSIWHESLGASERQRLLLTECLHHLDTFLEIVSSSEPTAEQPDTTHVQDEVDIVVAAESLRSAAEALARITGRGDSGDVEEVLGVVFEKFCVGK